MKFKLFKPVKPYILGQDFGAKALVSYYRENGVPMDSGHNGLDLGAAHGAPIYATHEGTAYYEVDAKQGHGVVLRTDEQFDYLDGQSFYKTIYWHLCDPKKDPQFISPLYNKKDVKIKAGDVIGYADSTGLSTGDHLHFGLKPCALMEPPNTWFNLEQNNGFMGAIDPKPFFSGLFAEDIKNIEYPLEYDMQFGNNNAEVKKLQLKLQKLGYFPITQICTGIYGNVTREAVYVFQQENVVMTWMERWYYRGLYCGGKTRMALNRL